MFVMLEAEMRAARAAVSPCQPYLFVDFTAKELLPAWITQDMIGGRFLLAGEVGLANGCAVSSTVSGDRCTAFFPFDRIMDVSVLTVLCANT